MYVGRCQVVQSVCNYFHSSRASWVLLLRNGAGWVSLSGAGEMEETENGPEPNGRWALKNVYKK